MKVLVLAGDAKARALIQSALERSMHDVRSAASAEEALKLVESARPRLIVLDEDVVSDIKRTEFFGQVRSAGLYIYVLGLSASTQMPPECDDTLRKPFSPSDLAGRVALAQRFLMLGDQLSEARDQIENLGIYDPLTGLMNRSAFMRTAQGELERARRTAAPLSVISLDLDNFNDLVAAYGTSAADQALKAIAVTIRERSRPYDCVGRWSGDEFLVALPGVIGEDAEKIAERIIKGVIASDIVYQDQTLIAGISAGIASVLQIHTSTEVQALIEQARQARARAREKGGNQVFLIFG